MPLLCLGVLCGSAKGSTCQPMSTFASGTELGLFALFKNTYPQQRWGDLTALFCPLLRLGFISPSVRSWLHPSFLPLLSVGRPGE